MGHRIRMTLAALVALAVGCSTGPGDPSAPAPPPSQPAPELASAYQGTVHIEGSALAVRLTLSGPATELDASLSVRDLSLVATGSGALEGERLELILFYGTDCPGQVRVEARVSPGGELAQGRLVAADCTGTEEGRLTLRSGAAGLPDASGARPAAVGR
ncbi:MAG: hypothetical protein RH859_09885 [Longimicrobiales bacterium]